MKTYNWEGVNPDGYFLDKLEPIPSADRKSGSAGMPRPNSYAVFCLKKKKRFVAFVSCARDLFLKDTNVNIRNVFENDLQEDLTPPAHVTTTVNGHTNRCYFYLF